MQNIPILRAPFLHITDPQDADLSKAEVQEPGGRQTEFWSVVF